jgi:benzodiazapine receptor
MLFRTKKNHFFVSFHCEVLFLLLVLLIPIPLGTPLTPTTRNLSIRLPWVQYRIPKQPSALTECCTTRAESNTVSTRNSFRTSAEMCRINAIQTEQEFPKTNPTPPMKVLCSGIYSPSSFSSLATFVWSAVTARIPSRILVPAIYILVTISGGNLGTPFVIAATKSWYERIPKPKWTPPNFVFAPVWLTLYTLIGLVSFRMTYLLPMRTCITKLCYRLTVTLFGIHYVLNIIWAPIFFGGKRLRLGHVLNILLIATLLPVLYGFYQMDQLSALLLLPYLIWLVVAAALSDGICKLNPTTKGYNNAMLEADISNYQQQAAKYVGL